jgi:hypothetical protein
MADDGPTYYTVVYRVEGGRDLHNEWWRKVSNTFADQPYIKVVASASFDALSKLDELDEPAW